MAHVLLVIPPDYGTNFPPLGTPVLTAFLKKNGFGVCQKDLNLGYRDFLLRRIDAPGWSREGKKIVLKPLLRAFFNRKLKHRYYARYLVRGKDPLFADLTYGNNSTDRYNVGYLMLGDPGMSPRLMLEVSRELLRQKVKITTPANHVYAHPRRYGIAYAKHLPFQFFIPFRNLDGMTMDQAQSLKRIYETLLSRNEKHPSSSGLDLTRFKKQPVRFSLNNETITLNVVHDGS
jgi:hypothetical protein